MLCPLCKQTARGFQCPGCYKKYEADVRAGRIPQPLTAANYEYGAWEEVQLIKRRGIASGWTDEKIIQTVRELAEREVERVANIQKRRAQEEEQRRRVREQLAKNKFNF